MTEDLTPHEAARVMAQAAGYEDALIQRAEGLTSIIWGIVTPAIFLSYAFAAVVEAPPAAMATLWAPWVSGGYLATMALWRAVALERPATAQLSPRTMFLRWLGFTAIITAAFAIVRPTSGIEPLFILGAAFLAMGLFNPFDSSPLGRRLSIVAGAAIGLSGGVLLLLGLPIGIAGALSIVLSGAPILLVGVYQTLRG